MQIAADYLWFNLLFFFFFFFVTSRLLRKIDLSEFIDQVAVQIRFRQTFLNECFDIVDFSFLDGDVPRATSYCVYVSRLVCLLEHLVKSVT